MFEKLKVIVCVSGQAVTVRFCFNNNKNTKLKKYKNIERNIKNVKNMFFKL